MAVRRGPIYGLKRYDQAIDLARRVIAINPNIANIHLDLVAGARLDRS